MYKSKYFTLKDLLPKELQSLPITTGWLLLDPRILTAGDRVKKLYGDCTINGNGLNDCGFRLHQVGEASLSQHLFGRAEDIHILAIQKLNLSKEEKIKAYDKIRDELAKMPEFNDIRFEYGISWLHIDCGNADIKKFNPK